MVIGDNLSQTTIVSGFPGKFVTMTTYLMAVITVPPKSNLVTSMGLLLIVYFHCGIPLAHKGFYSVFNFLLLYLSSLFLAPLFSRRSKRIDPRDTLTLPHLQGQSPRDFKTGEL